MVNGLYYIYKLHRYIVLYLRCIYGTFCIHPLSSFGAPRGVSSSLTAVSFCAKLSFATSLSNLGVPDALSFASVRGHYYCTIVYYVNGSLLRDGYHARLLGAVTAFVVLFVGLDTRARALHGAISLHFKLLACANSSALLPRPRPFIHRLLV